MFDESTGLLREKRNLIYMICMEPEAGVRTEQLRILIESLQLSGWQGDIAVIASGQVTEDDLTRNAPESTGKGRLYVVQVPFTGGGLVACRMRFKVAEWLDLESYEWCLYLDCDIVVRKPIDSFFTPEVEADFLVTEIRGRDMWCHSAFGGFLPEQAKAETKGHHAIQSGHLAFRGSVAARLLDRWSEIDRSSVRDGYKATDQSSQNRLVWECRAGRARWRVKSLPHHFAISPHAEQGRRLGIARSMGAHLWHYWGWLRNQEIRVDLAGRELARLRSVSRSLRTNFPIEGHWLHTKLAENLENTWTFSPDGLVWVCSGLIGHYTIDRENSAIYVNWMSPPRSDWPWNAMEAIEWVPGESLLRGASFRNGSFTLERL